MGNVVVLVLSILAILAIFILLVLVGLYIEKKFKNAGE